MQSRAILRFHCPLRSPHVSWLEAIIILVLDSSCLVGHDHLLRLRSKARRWLGFLRRLLPSADATWTEFSVVQLLWFGINLWIRNPGTSPLNNDPSGHKNIIDFRLEFMPLKKLYALQKKRNRKGSMLLVFFLKKIQATLKLVKPFF